MLQEPRPLLIITATALPLNGGVAVLCCILYPQHQSRLDIGQCDVDPTLLYVCVRLFYTCSSLSNMVPFDRNDESPDPRASRVQ
jgi:hypothetical protein